MTLLRACAARPALHDAAIGDGGIGVFDQRTDFEIGDLRVRPLARVIATGTHHTAVEPLVMQLLVSLSAAAGQLVTRRDLFARLWGAQSIGDDSLNRLVTLLRKALRTANSRWVSVETVPAGGYILRLIDRAEGIDPSAEETLVAQALLSARDSWHLAWPAPDLLRLESLRHACALAPGNADAHGWYALLCRHAAEYSDPAIASGWVARCASSAQAALALVPGHPVATVALTSVSPLLGRWGPGRDAMLAVLADHPGHPVAQQDLSVIEMATGRIRAAKAIRDRLIAREPFAALHCYKSVYQNWSIGEHAAMDRAAERGMALWPLHPAMWTVRLWTLAYTGRAAAALAMLDHPVRADLPDPTLRFLRGLLEAVTGGSRDRRDDAAAAARALASQGPTHAVAAMFALGLLERHDALLEVAHAYFFSDGPRPVPLHHAPTEPALNEQHRRLTQILFTPVFAGLRDDPRFAALCQRTGLTDYWRTSDLTPDYAG